MLEVEGNLDNNKKITMHMIQMFKVCNIYVKFNYNFVIYH